MADRQYKILIVDDSKAVLQKICGYLKENPSFQIKTTTKPLKAYDMIENEPFDIVISDIAMPEMDGLTLLRKIKNHNGMIQVIMITGYITINNILNAFRYGAFDLFFKPFAPEDILRSVEAAAAKLDRVSVLLEEVAAHQGF